MPTTAVEAPTIYHITHWKAGSQWVRGVLEELFADRVIVPGMSMNSAVYDEPVRRGCIYAPLYLTRQGFDASTVSRVPHRKFVVIRDLRDTLVSWYFSLRNSHPVNETVDELRPMLQGLSKEEGLLHLVNDRSFYGLAMIPATWRTEPCLMIRYEDLVADPMAGFSRIMAECELSPPEDRFAEVVERWTFRTKTGRKPGEEDLGSHMRKGIVGDWQNHFTPRVRDCFKTRYADLLQKLGYEPTQEWF